MLTHHSLVAVRPMAHSVELDLVESIVVRPEMGAGQAQWLSPKQSELILRLHGQVDLTALPFPPFSCLLSGQFRGHPLLDEKLNFMRFICSSRQPFCFLLSNLVSTSLRVPCHESVRQVGSVSAILQTAREPEAKSGCKIAHWEHHLKAGWFFGLRKLESVFLVSLLPSLLPFLSVNKSVPRGHLVDDRLQSQLPACRKSQVPVPGVDCRILLPKQEGEDTSNPFRSDAGRRSALGSSISDYADCLVAAPQLLA